VSAVSALAPLRLRPFRLLVTGRVVSTLGNSVAPIALAFAVLDLTHSAGQLGLVVGSRSLVNVLFILFGGVVADRLPRNLLMVGSGLAAGASQGGAAALILIHHATVPLLMGLGAINGMTAALSQPSSAALLPQTVPADLRKQANALSRLGSNSAMILGAPVGGLLVAGLGSGVGIAVDAATFLVASGCYALIRVPRVAPADQPSASTGGDRRPGLIAGLREGWQGFVGRTWLWVVVVGFTFFNGATAASVGVLGPVVADHSIGRKLWGFVLAAQTAGMIAGAFVAMRVKAARLLRYGVAAILPFALLPMFLALAPNVLVLMAVSVTAGLGIEQFGIAWETTMQENVPPDMLARVYSYDMLGSFIAIPAGEVAAGPAAQAFGTTTTLLVTAGVMVAATVGMLCSRDVRTLVHRPATPSPTPAPEEPVPALL
jgi:hypothetical protein